MEITNTADWKIITKYVPYMNHKLTRVSARIVAWSGDTVAECTVLWDYGLGADENYKAAAEKCLEEADRLDSYRFIQLSTKNGYDFIPLG